MVVAEEKYGQMYVFVTPKSSFIAAVVEWARTKREGWDKGGSCWRIVQE